VIETHTYCIKVPMQDRLFERKVGEITSKGNSTSSKSYQSTLLHLVSLHKNSIKRCMKLFLRCNEINIDEF